MDQKIEPLTGEDGDHVEKQRTWVRDHFVPEARAKYETVDGKLNCIQTILDSGWVEPTETWKLQSLGIAFGDILIQEIGFHWVTVEDEQGRDPALRLQETTIIFYPLTMISKRIERGEKVDVRGLLDAARQAVDRAILHIHDA